MEQREIVLEKGIGSRTWMLWDSASETNEWHETGATTRPKALKVAAAWVEGQPATVIVVGGKDREELHREELNQDAKPAAEAAPEPGEVPFAWKEMPEDEEVTEGEDQEILVAGSRFILLITTEGEQVAVNLDHMVLIRPSESGGSEISLVDMGNISVQADIFSVLSFLHEHQ